MTRRLETVEAEYVMSVRLLTDDPPGDPQQELHSTGLEYRQLRQVRVGGGGGSTDITQLVQLINVNSSESFIPSVDQRPG